MIDKNIYFLKIYSAISVDFLDYPEWRTWADALIKISDTPKKWVIEMSISDIKNIHNLENEISSEIEWSEKLYDLNSDLKLSFGFLKNNLNGGGKDGFLSFAVGWLGIDLPIYHLENQAKKNLNGCISFLETMNNMDFLKKNSWIYNQ